jgi:hypothetical protein
MSKEELIDLGFVYEERNPFTGKPQWNFGEFIEYSQETNIICYRGGEFSMICRECLDLDYAHKFIEVLNQNKDE